MASGVFAELKWRGINCELASEWAKDKVWEETTNILNDQVFVFANQYHRIFRLKGKVDVIITDSPYLLGTIYDRTKNADLKEFVIKEFKKEKNTMDIFVMRVKKYNPKGRLQTLDESKIIDEKIKDLLAENGIPFNLVPGDKEGVDFIVEHIIERLDI